MTGPYISLALGEAHRAELRRQADRFRRGRPTKLRPAEGNTMAMRTVVWLIRTIRRLKGASVLPKKVPLPASEIPK